MKKRSKKLLPGCRELNLRHLEAAAVIARTASISKASPLLNLSQPAITQAIAKLEDQLGQTLFTRHPGGMAPTQAGQLLENRVNRALALLTEATRIAAPARHLTMAQLHAIAAVERAGSYVLAAAATATSQPALHRATGELEAILGTRLLAREGRTIRPTAAATRLVRPIRLALAELNAGIDELNALTVSSAGRIAIGAMPLGRAFVLPCAAAAFCAAHPAARLHILEGPYSELLAGLRHGEIDLLLGALRDPLPSPDIAQRALFSESVIVVAGTTDPLANRPTLTPAETLGHKWAIAPAGTPLRHRWETWFRQAGLPPPEPAVECSSVVAIRGLLLEGGWLTLLSPDQFRIERAAGLLAPSGGPLAGSRRPIGITTRTDWHPTQTQREFIALLEQVARTKHPQTE